MSHANEDPSAHAPNSEFERLVASCEGALRRSIALRMDTRLRARLDPDDVIQETLAEAAHRFAAWQAEPTMPFGLWLRFLALQQLAMAHRRHIGTAARSAEREAALESPPANSDVFAAGIADSITSPSAGAARAEDRQRVRNALDALAPEDREVLAMRHFEELDNSAISQLLGLTPSGASRRYLRAVERLKQHLDARR